MCGIIGYIGKNNPTNILFQGLKHMEYRGYDSAGIVVMGADKKPELSRAIGEVAHLGTHLPRTQDAHIGLGHTRWATHGGVAECNTHPHHSHDGKIYLVHNGIIENYAAIKKDLEDTGVEFYGQTDSEVLANLMAYYYQQCGNLIESVRHALSDASGAYGLAVFTSDNPDQLIATKNGSPLILGIAKHGCIIASDTSAIGSHTSDIIYLQDGEMVILDNARNYSIETLAGDTREKKIEKIEHGQSTVGKGAYEHYMMKEICQQPEVIRNTIRGRLNFDTTTVTLGGIEPVMDQILTKKKIIIIGCGGSYIAGLSGKNFFQEIAGIECEVHIGSEYRYQKNFWDPNSMIIAVSQSGETADLIASLKEAKQRNILTLGVVNVPGSTIANMTDAGIFTHAGKEVCVASTKATLAQMVVLFMMALAIGERKDLNYLTKQRYMKYFKELPGQIEEILKDTSDTQHVAENLADYHNAFYLGRYYQYPIALEGALKLKEISYIHSEGYQAGELKHGPLALIDEDTPTILLDPCDALEEKTGSAKQEIEARNGKVFTISDRDDADIQIPKTLDILYPFLTLIPTQLLAYFAAKKLGREIDKPRNLAKSVTVE